MTLQQKIYTEFKLSGKTYRKYGTCWFEAKPENDYGRDGIMLEHLSERQEKCLDYLVKRREEVLKEREK